MNGHVFASTVRRVRPAFTLVELLVVIVIIGILIALLIPAVTAAMTTARNAVMAVELGSMATALEAYKTEFGSYPPDFASTNNAQDSLAIANHLGRNHRYRNKLADSPKGDGQFINLDPSEALVFWLRGFSSNQQLPLSGQGTRTPIFEFDETRLSDVDGDGYQEYYPTYSTQPYVYFHKESYQGLTTNNIPISTNVVLKPYVSEVGANGKITRFVEPNKYQIVCAGQDATFGAAGGLYPDGVGYSEADEDNITSFSDGKTLEDAIP